MAALTAKYGYDMSGVSLGDPWEAPGASSTYQGSSRMILLARNTSTNATATVTVVSQPNEQYRTGDKEQALAAGKYSAIFLRDEGWLDIGGKLTVEGDASIETALINIRD